ncbi:PQQ-binding-like beta-propeller repeat protein [Reinekea marina]|uniref:Outer membrane protein assembly factor BamB n=1 Tax=Reinekea marina TaxID=1310421 RepID=A0ABV7WU88_9GAMM|nr:PQQ-binding-like beta-propeller repeat protein [Reinekea marina]MDN3649260.1 PQQ-binding-like beta-propeller repeat protein [Reinekea marina]
MKVLQLFIAVGFVALFASCSSSSIKEQAAVLPETLPSEVDVEVQWWQVLGDETADDRFGKLAPTVFNNHVFVPLANGEIVELNEQGKELKRINVGVPISAPIAMSEDFSIALDLKGNVSAFDKEFSLLWKTPLKAIATRSAVFSGDRVFIQTIDGRVTALERLTGRLLWSYQDAEPSLTLTGTAQPILVPTAQGEILATGLANGKFIAIETLTGNLAWEYRIAKASGKTEMSRLVDVDSTVAIIDGLIVVTGYQGGLVIINPENGQMIANKPFSSYRGVAIDGPLVFGVLDNSHIVALETNTLAEAWVNHDFEYRQVSEVVVLGQYLVMSDIEGYLHVLDKKTGQWLGSRHIDWQGSNSFPVRFNDGVLLQGYSSRIKYVTIP